jgi:hypothetical protein
MKYVKFMGFVALSVGFMACNNDADTTATTDTTTTDTITSTTTANNVDYAAMADSFRVNSQAGVYLNPKTGKPLRIKYDVTTRKAVNEETNEPVWRYVDKRNWWVYGYDNDNWNQVGTAKMQGDKLLYQDDSDMNKWVTYDVRWSDDETSGTQKVSDDGNKIKDGDTKVKVADDGNKVKVTSGDDKTKIKDGKVKN